MAKRAALLLMLALAALPLASCGTFTPWATPEEADEIATQRVDELEVAVEAATGLEVTREAGALPPRQGTDWGEIIVLAITALTGTAGAVGIRAYDHRRKRLAAQAA